MVSYKALNTTIEAPFSQTRDGVGNGDGGQTAAIIEAAISKTRDGISSTTNNHSFRDNNLSRILITIGIILIPLKCNRSSLLFPI